MNQQENDEKSSRDCIENFSKIKLQSFKFLDYSIYYSFSFLEFAISSIIKLISLIFKIIFYPIELLLNYFDDYKKYHKCLEQQQQNEMNETLFKIGKEVSEYIKWMMYENNKE